MYRPDRIGPWPIGNLGKALLVDAKANFDAVDVAYATYGCYSLNTTSGENFACEKVVFSDTNITLANTQQVGIGIQISGTETEQHRHMYSVSGSITWRSDKDTPVEFVIGRLASAPSASANVIVANPIILPLNIAMKDVQQHYYAINTSVITTQIDGGSDPATFFDVAAFWRIGNLDGTASTMVGLTCNISFQRYTEDFLTYDPAR